MLLLHSVPYGQSYVVCVQAYLTTVAKYERMHKNKIIDYNEKTEIHDLNQGVIRHPKHTYDTKHESAKKNKDISNL